MRAITENLDLTYNSSVMAVSKLICSFFLMSFSDALRKVSLGSGHPGHRLRHFAYAYVCMCELSVSLAPMIVPKKRVDGLWLKGLSSGFDQLYPNAFLFGKADNTDFKTYEPIPFSGDYDEPSCPHLLAYSKSLDVKQLFHFVSASGI